MKLYNSGWKTSLIGSLSVLIVSSASIAVDTDIVLLQDNFNRENNGNGELNYSKFTKWIVTRGTVDLTGNGFWDLYPGNGLYVDLDGSTKEGGKIESRILFNLVPGTYKLQFDIGNNNKHGQNENNVTVMLGTFSEGFVYSKSFSRVGSQPYQTISETITVTTPTRGRLIFDQSGGDDEGIIIDNVKLLRLSNR